MGQSILRNYIYPIATLSGSVIGVGFLALPYSALHAGITTMLFYFLALTALMVSINLIFGTISLKTPDFKRFPGFVGLYLGKGAERFTLFFITLGTFGVLLAYIIVGGQFLATIFGGNFFYYSLLYFILASIVAYFNVTAIAKVEFWALCALLGSLVIIGIKAHSHITLGNLFSSTPEPLNLKNLLLPYGIIMFSLWGTGLIPEVEEMLEGRKQTLRRIIVIGTLIPAVIYLIFTLLVLGISGAHTTDSALTGLKPFLSPLVFSVALFIGVISTFIGFITNALFLKKTLVYDVHLRELPAWLITCGMPLLFFLLGIDSFIPIISFIGGVFIGINGIFILMIYRKLGGKAILIYPLSLVFILGIIYTFLYSW